MLIRSVQSTINTKKLGGKFNVVRDPDGMLRVVGRLPEGHVPETSRAPILLPDRNHFVDLLIDAEHCRNGHCGRNTVNNNLRQRYWILDGRHAVRRSWTRCMECRLRKAKPVMPVMGMLPECRITSGCPPFTYTGTDLFGPVEVTVGRHHEKRWGLLFTCMVTRAVHMEIISGLSLDETMMGFSRFVDTRGLPRHLYSDNGTNFVAAAKEIRKLQKYHECEWHFIPPASPHMGGAWESLVKQVKRVLVHLLKERFPKDQTLLTAIKSVENVVNSRPLSYVSSDPADLESLTPNHFLRGVGVASSTSSNGAAMKGSDELGDGITDDKQLWRKQWDKAQLLANQFWERWSKEVLPTLLEREKWNRKANSIAVGDLVIIIDDQRPRNEWMKGLVTNVFPGNDGVVRVVEVTVRSFKRKADAVYKRALSKICPTGLRVGDLATVGNRSPNQGAGNVGKSSS